jgi:hypothetical protein
MPRRLSSSPIDRGIDRLSTEQRQRVAVTSGERHDLTSRPSDQAQQL